MIRAMVICPTDRIATWCDGPVGLGHLMQFFFADDPREIQPLASRDGVRVLVTDARLDNREELAHHFDWNASEAAALPDSAFVLAAYEKWGEFCPAHLGGRFAFALWQPRERRLFCAIDRLGLSPLYYSHRDGVFAFATTLKGILARPQISHRFNERVLAEISVGLRRPSSETLYAEVSRIAGGHAMSVDAAGIRLTRYWHPELRPVLRLRSDADYVEAFRAEVKSAIRRSIQRIPGEVGLFLSGGLDSSAVAVIASELLAEHGRRLRAIHLVPTTSNRYAPTARELDESRFVRELQARAPKIDFHFVPAHTVSSPLETWDDFFSDHHVPDRTIRRWSACSTGCMSGRCSTAAAAISSFPPKRFPPATSIILP